MKANELRIGDYVNTEFGVREISGVYNDGIIQLQDGNESVIDEIEPIPLTEEWLLKFGFDKINHITNGVLYKKDWLRISTYLYADWRGGAIKKESLKYVHQLQNLYFALTGEELTIKL